MLHSDMRYCSLTFSESFFSFSSPTAKRCGKNHVSIFFIFIFRALLMALGEILIKRISRASVQKNSINENFPFPSEKSGAFTIFVRLLGKYEKNNNKKNDIFQFVIKPNHQSEAFL